MPRTSPSVIDVAPILSKARVSLVYWYLALALFTTGVGVVAGALFALPILSSGWMFLLALLELAIIWTAPTWVHRSPLNGALFFLFPFLSGLTVTPFLLLVASGYVNGVSILLNAAIATCLLSAASAVYAQIAAPGLKGRIGMFLFQALIGLIVCGLLQVFFSSLRSGVFELLLSAAGIVLFALFLAVDFQRASARSAAEHPMLLALSLYLDVFNLFLFVVRFMVALSGDRR